MEFGKPMRGYTLNPSKCDDADEHRNQQRLQSAFPGRASGKEKIEPHQARVMRLDGEADGHAENAEIEIAIFKEAPGSNNAKTYHNAGSVPSGKQDTTIQQEKRNEIE